MTTVTTVTTVTAAKSSNECRSASVGGSPSAGPLVASTAAALASATMKESADERREKPSGEQPPIEAISSMFFDEMDELEDAIYETRESLAEAVAREAYSEAAALVATCASLEARDTTLGIERAFKAAIEEERYADAARLRDEGGRRMLGWWVGREGPDDMTGHLVEVRRGVGRYVGVALDPNVFGSAGTGTKRDELMDEREVVGVGENELFEVFYKRADRGGGFLSQATVFDGRMVFLEDEEDLDDGVEEEEDDGEDDGIRTVEDLLSMGEEDLLAVVDEGDEMSDEQTNGMDDFHALDVVRQPAEIEWLDRDRFVLRMECADLDNSAAELEELERMVMDVVRVGEKEEGGSASVSKKRGVQINYRRLGEVRICLSPSRERIELERASLNP